MGAVLGGIFVVFLVLGLLGAIGERANTREWRPFVGIFIIAGMIALMGVILGLGLPGVTPIFIGVAKWVAIVGAVLLCLRIIGKVAVSFFRA